MTTTQTLNTLETRGLIRLAAVYPEVEYLFQHALIQEAAYHTLVKSNRRMLHKAVGESLELLYPTQLASPELTPILARHFAEGGDPARALRYYALAGRAASDRYANAEAIHHYGLALEMAAKLATGGTVAFELFLRRGHAFELNAQDAEALVNYEAMQAWAEARGDRRAILAALNARATIYVKPSVQQNQALGYELSQQALALARELGDRPAEAKALWNLAQHYLAAFQSDEALQFGEQALAIARAQGLRETTAYVLTDLTKVYFLVNRAGLANAALDEARAIWRELGMLNMLADNLATVSMMQVNLGNYETALAASNEALQVARSIGNIWNESYALYMVDMIHFDRGDIGRALETAETCLRLSQQAGFAEGINQMRFDLPLMLAYLGAWPRALEALAAAQASASGFAGGLVTPYLTEALVVHIHCLSGRPDEAQAAFAVSGIPREVDVLKHEFPLTTLFLVMVQAELALLRGDYGQGLLLVDGVLAYLVHNAVRLFFPDLLAIQSRLLQAAGRSQEAQSVLETARTMAEELGSRRGLWAILAGLAELAAGRQEHETARALRRQASEIIEYIAEHAGSADLRQSFLDRADVRALRELAEPTGPRQSQPGIVTADGR